MNLCEKCNQREATVHYFKNINGKEHKVHLCSACAEKMGLWSSSNFVEEEFLLGFPFFQNRKEEKIQEEMCPLCHSTLWQIRKKGKFGCSVCYETFGDRLDFSAFVGKGYTAGRVKGEKISSREENPGDEISRKKQELKEAVAAEDYEKAALLRDEIRKAEGKN